MCNEMGLDGKGGGRSQRQKLTLLTFIEYVVCTGGLDGACNVGDPGSIRGAKDPLEKGMATHSSILAWRIPWTEEPGELQSMGSQIVGHD